MRPRGVWVFGWLRGRTAGRSRRRLVEGELHMGPRSWPGFEAPRRPRSIYKELEPTGGRATWAWRGLSSTNPNYFSVRRSVFLQEFFWAISNSTQSGRGWCLAHMSSHVQSMSASRVMLLVGFSLLANVRGGIIDKVSFMTSGDESECSYTDESTGNPIHSSSKVCPGGPIRDFTGTAKATNVIPQKASVKLRYTGSLPGAMYISLVDRTLNNGSPCTNGAYAAAAADATHSGPLLATAAKVVTAQASVLLDASKEYEICYSATASNHADYGKVTATWAAVPGDRPSCPFVFVSQFSCTMLMCDTVFFS